jgi:hypothetical protein
MQSDLASANRRLRERAGLEEARGPKPFVDAHAVSIRIG